MVLSPSPLRAISPRLCRDSRGVAHPPDQPGFHNPRTVPGLIDEVWKDSHHGNASPHPGQEPQHGPPADHLVFGVDLVQIPFRLQCHRTISLQHGRNKDSNPPTIHPYNSDRGFRNPPDRSMGSNHSCLVGCGPDCCIQSNWSTHRTIP